MPNLRWSHLRQRRPSQNIEVPVQREVSIIAEEDSYTGPANGIGKTMYFTVLNEGNDDESYRLELTSNFLLEQISLH